MLSIKRSKPLAIVLFLGLTSAFISLQDSFKWGVHDSERPLAPMVTPGIGGAPPSDAVVLLGANAPQGAGAWHCNKQSVPWVLDDGILTVKPGTGAIATRAEFGDCQLHLEWRMPEGRKVDGQAGGNSGVFLMDRYEVQILESFANRSYADGMAGAIYGQYPPLANPCRPPGQWNVYDITFRAPVFHGDGKLSRPATMSIHFNGVLVQENVELLGPTRHKVRTSYTAHGPKGPLALQDHGDPVSFRNIWIRELGPRLGAQ